MQNTQTVLLRIMECSGWKGFARSPVPPHPFRDEEAAAQRGEPACLQWQLTGSRGAQVSGALLCHHTVPARTLKVREGRLLPVTAGAYLQPKYHLWLNWVNSLHSWANGLGFCIKPNAINLNVIPTKPQCLHCGKRNLELSLSPDTAHPCTSLPFSSSQL